MCISSRKVCSAYVSAFLFKSTYLIWCSYSGETAQRWLAPGDTKGGGIVHNFYTCCGGAKDSPGCCARPHITFDEPEEFSLRKPGMGVDEDGTYELRKELSTISMNKWLIVFIMFISFIWWWA